MTQNLPTSKLTKSIIFVFGFVALSFFSVSQVSAATTYTNQYYTPFQYAIVAPTLTTSCSNPSGCNPTTTCWNSERVGITDCGSPPTACSGGDAWTKYDSKGCWQTGVDADGNETCESVYAETGDTCSTGDKYNSGNPPVMNAGYCSCTVGGGYKTCCNGQNPVNARNFPVDPYAPDEADCGGYTTVRCGGGGEPACGAPACQTLCTRTPGSYAGSICTSCNWLTIERYNCDGTTYLAEGQTDSSCNTPEFCPTTDCNTDKVCSACTLTSSGNACSRNGTQTCTYTGSTTNPDCNQVDAPPETCSIDNCSPGYRCPSGVCIPDDGGGGCTPGTCDAATPACGQTTYGSDGCSSCSKTGPACTGGCGATCTYSEDGVCKSGNCLDSSQPCSTNVNCGYVLGCSSGTQVLCTSPSPSPCVGPGCGEARFKCSSTSCVQDDANGSYTSSTCDGSCSPCPPEICKTGPLCPVMHPFAQIRNLTKGENFPSSVSYKGITYNLTSPGACASSGPNCGLAIESAAQSINADPGDVLEMRVMEANENERSGAIHSVEVRFWGDKGITSYPNGLADDEAGNGDFCTNQYFNGLTMFAAARIYCVAGGSMGCPWAYSAAIEDKKSEPGEPQAWGTGVVSTNWNTARYQVAADAVPGTTAGITAVTFPVSGIQTPSGQCFWENNGSVGDKDFRWKTDGKMCPFTNDMFYDSLPLTVQINGCRGYNTIDAPTEGTRYTLNNAYTYSGWSTFCSGPNGTNRNRVDPYICDQGTWNNCRYIGPTSSSVRQDIVNLGWTCGNLNPNSDGWTFNWTPDSTYLGNKTLRVASINDNNNPPNCVVWESKNINIAVSTVPISGYIRSFQTEEGIQGVQVAVTDNTLGSTRTSGLSDTSGFWQVDGFVRSGDSYAVRIPGSAPAGYILPPKTTTDDYSWNFNLFNNSTLGTNPWSDTRWGDPSYEGQKAGSWDCAGPDNSTPPISGRCNFVYDRDRVEPSPPPPIPTPNTNPWIQTTTGDVHSNTNINTPGGP